jgi:hypothetical protein
VLLNAYLFKAEKLSGRLVVLLPGRGVQFGGYSQGDVAHSGIAADSLEREEDNAQYKDQTKTTR